MLVETDHTIEINLVQVVKPYWINPTEALDYVLRSLRPRLGNKTVCVLANKECPVGRQPFQGMIDMIADALDLSADRLIVVTRDRGLHHPRATIQLLPRFDSEDIYYADRYLKHAQFTLDPLPRLFGCFIGRASIPRLVLAHHLETNHGPSSTVSMLCQPAVAEHNTASLQEPFFAHIHSWLHQRANRPDIIPAQGHLGSSADSDPVEDYPRIWREYRIEIVIETDYQTPCSVTEKTLKCLASGKPFLSMAGAGTMRGLRDLGFQTFHGIINESYDDEQDWYQRLIKIMQEIDRLAGLGNTELDRVLLQMELRGQHNKRHFFNDRDWLTA